MKNFNRTKTNWYLLYFLRSACLFLFSLFCFNANAQFITHLEYFFDTDPGVGNGTQITLPVPADTIIHNTTINTTGLQPGNHALFIRSKLATGQWSLYEPQQFYIEHSIIAAEYFFDADPGAGNATALPVVPGVVPATHAATVSTTGLAGGNHVLFLRTKDASGTWSLYEPREFHIRSTITAAEYFFDNDPGAGNSTPLPVAALTEPATYNNTINTTGLTGGNHILFIRTKDEQGKWSLYEPREFHIRSTITAAEYFFDNDPGVGSATSLPVAALTEPATYSNTITATGLTGGNHVLFIRTKDEQGKWSLYEPREFYVRTNIIAAEYFIDTDPGVGNAIPLPAGIPSDTININTTIPTGLLSLGTHYVFVRTKDIKGIWSLYEPKQFFVTDNPLPVTWLSFDAMRKEDDAFLTWVTAAESGCRQFDVERMIPSDGNAGEFIKIGEVPGSGNTSIRHEYNFTDKDVKYKGVCHYRIKQVDFNGDFLYSQIVAVNFDHTKSFIKIYPNPSSEFFTLDVTGSNEEILSLEIINNNGQLVKSLSNLSFPYHFGNDLKPATYFVTVKKQAETMHFKIVKTK